MAAEAKTPTPLWSVTSSGANRVVPIPPFRVTIFPATSVTVETAA